MQQAQSYQAIPDEENNAIEEEDALKLVKDLTDKELERCVLDHDIFMKNIDIVSRNEASFSALVPQLVILLKRMQALEHTTTAKYAFRIVCIYVYLRQNSESDWKGYAAFATYLQQHQFCTNYEEELIEALADDATAEGTPVNQSYTYSLDEFRRRIYELKCDCVDVSCDRYTAAKLRLWTKAENRDNIKMYMPLLFSSLSLLVSLITLILKLYEMKSKQ